MSVKKSWRRVSSFILLRVPLFSSASCSFVLHFPSVVNLLKEGKLQELVKHDEGVTESGDMELHVRRTRGGFSFFRLRPFSHIERIRIVDPIHSSICLRSPAH